MELKDILSLVIAFFGALGAAAAAIAAFTSKKSADRSANAADRSAQTAEDALRHNNRLASVQFVIQALKEFAADKDMQDVFYRIEYSKFLYTDDFHGSAEERRIDRLLRHFSSVALAWRNGMIDAADLDLVRYYVLRVMGDPEVQKYVDFVFEVWAQKTLNIKHPYKVLVEFGDFLEKKPPDEGK